MEIKISQEVINKCVEKWGEQRQLFMVTEEIGELLQAMSKWRRMEKHDPLIVKNLIEEIADVIIVLKHLMRVVNITEENIQFYVDIKMGKLKERVERNIEK